MPREDYIVTLTGSEVALLQDILNKDKHSIQKRNKVFALLQAHKSWINRQISDASGMIVNAIQLLGQRFVKHGFEATVVAMLLTDGFTPATNFAEKLSETAVSPYYSGHTSGGLVNILCAYYMARCLGLFQRSYGDLGIHYSKRTNIMKKPAQVNVTATDRRQITCQLKFTLNELLVVIAIIVLLASMLMPMLQKSINSARKVSCANNMYGLYLASTEYSSEYCGYIPAPLNLSSEVVGVVKTEKRWV